VIPLELSMLGVASSVASSSPSVVQLKMEDQQSKQVMVTSEPASEVAAVSDSSPTSSAAAGVSIPLMPLPHFIVPLQSGGPSPEPTVVERDEASEPKRLRIAEEGWTSDS